MDKLYSDGSPDTSISGFRWYPEYMGVEMVTQKKKKISQKKIWKIQAMRK